MADPATLTAASLADDIMSLQRGSDEDAGTSEPGTPPLRATASSRSLGATGGRGASAGGVSTDTGMLMRLIDAQRARKLAEDDKRRLANRVKQLLKEEEKAKKRITETRKRAEEILSLKRRNEVRVAEKAAQKRELREHVAILHENHQSVKRDNQKRRAKAAKNLIKVKKHEADETRADSMENQKALSRQRKLAQERASETRQAIQRARSEASQKLMKAKVRHMRGVKEDYSKRLEEERGHLRETEDELAAMTRLERELIARLQQKQLEQETAYKRLETVIGLSPAKAARAGLVTTTGGREERGTSRPSTAPRALTLAATAPSAAMRAGTPTPPSPGPAAGFHEPTDDEISTAFGRLDADGTGFVKTSQLEALFRALGLDLKPAQVQQAVGQLDQSNTGKVSFGEFFMWWKG